MTILGIFRCQGKNIISCKMRLNPHDVRLKQTSEMNIGGKGYSNSSQIGIQMGVAIWGWPVNGARLGVEGWARWR